MLKVQASKKTTWNPSTKGIKCNTDGASRGNLGRSFGFCLRNTDGDLIYAQTEAIHKGTNIEAEATTIKKAITHCVAVNTEHICLETDSLLMKNILDGII